MEKSNNKNSSEQSLSRYVVVCKHFSRSKICREVKSIVASAVLVGLPLLFTVDAWGQQSEAGPAAIKSERMQAANEKKYEIRFPSCTFTPKAAVPKDLSQRLQQLIDTTESSKAHLIVQLEYPPGPAFRKRLANQGVVLLEPINRYTWRVSVTMNATRFIGKLEGIRWADIPRKEYKMAEGVGPAIEPLSYQLRPGGRIAYSVSFHKGTTADEVLALSRRIDIELENFDPDAFPLRGAVTVTVPVGGLIELAETDIVSWIELSPAPDKADNFRYAQILSNVRNLRGPPFNFNLDGTGITVGIWESGATIYDEHLDLAGRITVEAGQTAPYNDHATLVAGTIGASGVHVRDAEGMAPNVRITSWDSLNDVLEMHQAVVSVGASGQPTPIQISNHSYSEEIGWEWDADAADWNFTDDQHLFGCYSNLSKEFDRRVFEDGLLVVKSAGNERINAPDVPVPGQPADCFQGGFGVAADCIGNKGSAKNVITVGAMRNSRNIADYTSYGPTININDEGRIKPDLMAHGGYESISLISLASSGPTAQGVGGGTSMSTPVVSGIAALVLQDANDHGLPMTPAGMKALLIQTARDVQRTGQSNPGPDYATGWGIVDAESAIRLLRQGGLTQGALYGSEYTATTRSFSVPAGTNEVRVTLAWDDPPGIPGGQILMNDLDLRLISPNGTVFMPWILDPANPGNAALINGGNDDVNNVEQVLVRNTMAGFMPGIWTARISAEPGNLLEPPQDFALAGPLGLTIVEPRENHPVWAGTSIDGNRVFVALVASAGLDTSLENLTVKVDNTALNREQISLHSVVDHETWLVITPGAKPEGYYDLTITLNDMPDVADSALQSLHYKDMENRTVDRVVALDRTNSMIWNTITYSADEEKMESAREAARTYVDLSEDVDMIGVVSFQCHDENSNGRIEDNELSEPEFLLTLASDGGTDRRPDGRETITALAPRTSTCGLETSVGAGLLEAKAMLDANGRADSEKSIILVTDGLENYAPYWSQGEEQLKPVFAVGNIRVDAISIGLDADDDVLFDIANTTGGKHKNEAEGMGSLSLRSRLPNTFKSIDEDIRGEQRFYYQEGFPPISEKPNPREFTQLREGYFTVEPNLDWMTVSFHWSELDTVSELRLFNPDGVEVITTRRGEKHAVYRVAHPTAGEWHYEILVPSTALSDEFFATASGPTLLTARLRIGQTKEKEDGHWSTPVRVWIAENDATMGALVTATIRRPDKHKLYLDLLDGGTTSDGAVNDGVYAKVINETLPGPYHVDVVARGISASGEPFERYMSGTFLIPGRDKPPAQLGEGQPPLPGGILGVICAKTPWCCWLWLAFIITLAATLVALARLWCCIRG